MEHRPPSSATETTTPSDWGFPLRLHLSVIIVGLLACTALPLVWMAYTQGKVTALSAGEAQMRQLGLRSIEDYRNVFSRAYAAIETTSAVPQMLTPPPQDLLAKHNLLLRLLKSSFRIDGIYAGYADGTYVQAISIGTNPAWRDTLNAPSGAAFAVRTITKVIGIPVTTWTFFDKDARPLARRADRDDVFDPRFRPWYKAALSEGRTTSVGPYISAATNYLTLTFATPAVGQDRVVIGVDVMLVSLGEVVDIGTVSKQAHGYVFDNTGRLIVHSDPAVMTKLRDRIRRGMVLSAADAVDADSAIPAVTNLAQDSRVPDGEVVHFAVNGREYLAQTFHAEIAGLLKEYTVIIAAPLDELIGPVERTLRRNLAAAAAFLAAGAIAAIIISRLISRSLYALADEARQLGNLEFKQSRVSRSWISEVNALAKALGSARDAIRTFSLYVPRELVRRIVIAGQSAIGSASRQEITVLFTDIREFTTISERHSPEEVVALLSTYFETLNMIVERHGGTIVQYIGDSIFAMWNAPVHDERHVENACRCALSVKAAVDAMNAANNAAGRPELITRFGLHTGPAVVGSVGAESRRQYTAIGDTVNIASRLEGLNRDYGTSILVSSAIRDAVEESFNFISIGTVSVRGRTGQTELYELRG
ncbi:MULTISPECIES: adenylate/guanylate cyclase domain-containing protein [Rhizobium]|uniref:Adenylate/guanylate cyclase n=1 Tax=Rhizobium favelukesii TaxID=348824 RepID=W6RDM9_9HYPH|nr:MULTISPECIES: adenylate/guanylate cyclase domain-containing protein [Rhizobium]MCS0458870.1 adenylate/guanylate cyclase domain-containing protein [Rhizobium favelukesii]UFS82997.1 adenylate/guanylate cyclase domain-containing protein [Rhizobium sp. T136]CDM59392.1 adenylate/guanylate cyclase [Rhizobium favelukesii]